MMSYLNFKGSVNSAGRAFQREAFQEQAHAIGIASRVLGVPMDIREIRKEMQARIAIAMIVLDEVPDDYEEYQAFTQELRHG